MYDITVIGGGPGGYVSAIRAAQLGAKVCIVEKEKMGGTCLNWGCIPTKSLVASVNIINSMQKSDILGVNVKEYSYDFKKIMSRKDDVVNQLRKGIEYLLAKNNVEIIFGTGEILSKHDIKIRNNNKDKYISSKNIIVATGSKPLVFPFLNYNKRNIITSNELLEINSVPESMIVVGGGVIGCEFACIFNSLGTKVTVIEMLDAIIPNEDEEISKLLKEEMKKQGIEIINGIRIEKMNSINGKAVAFLEDGSEISAEKALISVGRKLNSSNVGLENVGVQTGKKGEILVDENMKTNVENIYAIGDVTGKTLLAHVASFQGLTAVNNIMDRKSSIDYNVIPGCIFTNPEVAGVGITEKKSEEQGIKVNIGRFPFAASGKALTLIETEGMVKIISDYESDKILGVHIIGPHATDLIAEGALAISNGLTTSQLAQTIHAHPTLSESMMEAAEDVHNMAIHF